jgi:tetratricopeptide (TPR) repeat protein
MGMQRPSENINILGRIKQTSSSYLGYLSNLLARSYKSRDITQLILLLVFILLLSFHMKTYISRFFLNRGYMLLMKNANSSFDEAPFVLLTNMHDEIPSAFFISLNLDPKSVHSLAALGFYSLLKGDLSSSVQEYQSAIYLSGDHIPTFLWLDLGLALDLQDDHSEAIRVWKKGGAAPYFRNLAEANLNKKNYAKGLLYANYARQIDPRLSGSSYLIGLANLKLGAQIDAETGFKNEISISLEKITGCSEKSQHEVLFYIGKSYAELGYLYLGINNHLEIARMMFEMAIKCNNPDAYSGLGWTLFKLGHIEESIRVINAGIVLYPDNWDNYSTLGDINIAQGNILLAISNYKKAIQINPNIPALYLKLASSYARSGECQIALQTLANTPYQDSNDTNEIFELCPQK